MAGRGIERFEKGEGVVEEEEWEAAREARRMNERVHVGLAGVGGKRRRWPGTPERCAKNAVGEKAGESG